MKKLIEFLSNIYETYSANRKILIKNFIIAAAVNLVMLFFQYFYRDKFFSYTNIYNNVTNFAYALLYYVMINSINNFNYDISESVKKLNWRKVIILLGGYIVLIVPFYIIDVILPNIKFFASPFIRLLSVPVLIILFTLFENFMVTITLRKDNNFPKIVMNTITVFKKTLPKLTLLKIAMFALILVPGIILFFLGTILFQPLGLILLIVLPLMVLPIYVFCVNEIVKQFALSEQ